MAELNPQTFNVCASTDERDIAVQIPRPWTISVGLSVVGERYAQVISEQDSLCHVGIQTIGVQLAVAGMWARSAKGMDNDTLMPFSIREPEYFEPGNRKMVLVDNSVKSGETLARAIGFMHRRGIMPELFVKLVDYQDEREAATQRWIREELGMVTVSLFTLEEVIEYCAGTT